MSFGFAVGDFITVADRAVVIYRKCKAAPDDYASLTHHVHTLATVLEDTRSFLDAEVPSSPLRLEALVSAREGCRTTLNEVEAFLDKHVDVTKTKNRNYIRIAKFIAKDLDGLKLKLWSNTNLLQLSLASLTNLSLIGVQTALDLILQEYRNGRRPPSVLSTAILDDQPANVDDLRSQLSMDLEEKDIHPEAISLNQKFIDSWLDDAQGNSSLDESVSDDEDFIPRSPNIDGAFGDPALSTQGLTSPNHVRAKTSVLKESQRPNFNFVSSKQVVVPPQDDTKPIPSLPSLPSPSENLREELKRPNEPELAYEILRPLLRIKYPIDTASVNAGLAHRISQAFNQQDSDHYGLIARPDVWSVSQLLLQASPCGLWATRSSEEWRAWTFLFDSDRDGQYSADEYDSLIRGIISTATEQRNLHKQKSRKRLKKEVTARREFSTDHLPWKCPHDDQTPVLGSELVTGNIKVSSQHLSNFSFTAMAVAADQICNEMHRFEKTWLVGIPVSLHSRLARSLQTARNAALKYAVLEHQLGVQFLGDLDIALIYGCIAFNLPSPLEQYERKSLDLIRALHASFQVMCTLQVFRERLQKIHKRLKKEQVKEGSYEEALETEWENQALQPCAEMIARDMELWNDEVYNRIRTFRLDRSLGMERECATRAIKCYNERYDAKFSFSAFSGKLFEKESDPGTEGMPELSLFRHRFKLRLRLDIPRTCIPVDHLEWDNETLPDWYVSKGEWQTNSKDYGFTYSSHESPIWRIMHDSRITISIRCPKDSISIGLEPFAKQKPKQWKEYKWVEQRKLWVNFFDFDAFITSNPGSTAMELPLAFPNPENGSCTLRVELTKSETGEELIDAKYKTTMEQRWTSMLNDSLEPFPDQGSFEHWDTNRASEISDIGEPSS